VAAAAGPDPAGAATAPVPAAATPDVTGIGGPDSTNDADGATGDGADSTSGATAADGTTGTVRAGAAADMDGATDGIGDDAGDRRRVLAGLAVVVAVAALLVTFVLNRPTGTPQASAEAARGGPGGIVATTVTITATATDAAATPTGSAGAAPAGTQLPAADGGPTGGPAAGGPGGQGGGTAGGPGAGGGNTGGPGGGPGTGGPGGGGATPAVPPPAGGGRPVRLGTAGGVIVAVCNGGTVNVTGAEPAAGGSLVSLQSGPRDKSRVEFNLAGLRLRFEVRCVGGVPVATPD
jgi:hypothetical protein